MGYGWPFQLCLQAARAAELVLTSSTQENVVVSSSELIQQFALLILRHSTILSLQSSLTPDALTCSEANYDKYIRNFGSDQQSDCTSTSLSSEIWTEEVESLEAIFDTDFHVKSLVNGEPYDNGSSLHASVLAELSLKGRCDPVPSCLKHWKVDNGSIVLHVSRAL